MVEDADDIAVLRARIARLEADLAGERALGTLSAGSYFTVPEHMAFHRYAAAIDLATATAEQRMIKLASAMILNAKAIARRQKTGPSAEPVKHYHEQGPYGVEVFSVFGESAIRYIDRLRAELGKPEEKG